MCTSHDHTQGEAAQAGAGKRSFLSATALLGGYEYAGRIDQIHHRWLGDVRIVDRALPVSQFMNH
ncbi:hypothetical protein ACFVHS_39375 [Streptomyces sp. NPDC057746]|uniref:hypothetical protein n=1 Tax=Streptomyces sp. NPDC057746 TaxID=3346237 RepID=UPI00369B61BD